MGDSRRSATQPGHSAEPEPSFTVSAQGASVPSAWPLQGYAPGNYMGICHDCGETFDNLDKRATRCLQCAVLNAKRAIADLEREVAAVQSYPLDEATRLECLKLAHDWGKMRYAQGFIATSLDDVAVKAGEYCAFVAASGIEARRVETTGSTAKPREPARTPKPTQSEQGNEG